MVIHLLSNTFELHGTSAGRVSICQVELIEALKILTPEPFLLNKLNSINDLAKVEVAGSNPVSRSISPVKSIR